MKKMHLYTAAGLATAVAVPAALLAGTAPAYADTERAVRCAGAAVELSVDRERGGFEVEADIDDARPGSRWRIALRHDGALVTRVVRTADAEGDLGLDRFRRNTAGKDTFTLTATRLATGKACAVRVVTR